MALLFFCVGDGVAELARVISVECLFRAFHQAVFRRVIDHHFSPGQDLKHAVVAAAKMQAAGNDENETEDSQIGGRVEWGGPNEKL